MNDVLPLLRQNASVGKEVPENGDRYVRHSRSSPTLVHSQELAIIYKYSANFYHAIASHTARPSFAIRSLVFGDKTCLKTTKTNLKM